MSSYISMDDADLSPAVSEIVRLLAPALAYDVQMPVDDVQKLAQAIVDLFRPQIHILTVVLQATNELSDFGVAEYVVRMHRWIRNHQVTLDIRSSMGLSFTLEITEAGVPIFFDDPTYVGLWLPDWQTDALRVAYVTYTYRLDGLTSSVQS